MSQWFQAGNENELLDSAWVPHPGRAENGVAAEAVRMMMELYPFETVALAFGEHDFSG
jgi:hypothetical protein